MFGRVRRVVVCVKVSVDGSDFMTTCPSTSNCVAHICPGAIANIQGFVGSLSMARRRYIVRTANGCDFLLLCLLSDRKVTTDVIGPGRVGRFSHVVVAIAGASAVSTYLVTVCKRGVGPPICGVPSRAIVLLGRGGAVVERLGGRLVTAGGLGDSLMILPFRSGGKVGTLSGAVSFLTGRVRSLRTRLSSLTSARFSGRVGLLASIGNVKVALTATLVVTANKFSCFSGTGRISHFVKVYPACRRSKASIRIGNNVGQGKSSGLHSLLCITS